MASSLNKVELIGNLGADPEVRTTPNGKSVANMTVVTSESYKDKNTGEQKNIPEYHRVTIWGKLAEVAGQYLKKGSKVYICGKNKTRKWQDQQGQDRYTTEVIVEGYKGEMIMLGGGNGNAGGQSNGGQNAPQNGVPDNMGMQPGVDDMVNDFDDDVPFG